MRRLTVFNQISLDGYFKAADGDIRWTHEQPEDAEFTDFVAGNAASGGTLLYGRKTYELMASFWPTPMAAAQFPGVAKHINASPKIVFSRTLTTAAWANTTIVARDPVAAVIELKQTASADLAILGSGTIVTQLARAGLIDEYQFLVLPVVLGAGATMFEGLGARLALARTKVRTFGNGNTYLVYEPRPA